MEATEGLNQTEVPSQSEIPGVDFFGPFIRRQGAVLGAFQGSNSKQAVDATGRHWASDGILATRKRTRTRTPCGGICSSAAPHGPFLQFPPSWKSCCHQGTNYSLPLLRLPARPGSSHAHRPVQERGQGRLQAAGCGPVRPSEASPQMSAAPWVSPQKLAPADKKPFLWPNKSPLLFFFLLLPSYKKGCLLSISRRKPEQLGAFPS